MEELIEARGDLVIHETGVACTCRSEDSYGSMTTTDNQPTTSRRMNCSMCRGEGYVFRNAQCIRGLITSIQAGPNRKLLEGGYAVAGDAVFSPSLNSPILTDFDRVTFTQCSPISDGQVILRGAALHNQNQLIEFGLAPNEDQLWYQGACALWCEDSNGVIYDQNTDFVLADKVIRWVPGGKSPDTGTFYTLKYTAYLEWIVYNTPMSRIDDGRSLAQKVILRKKHVAFFTANEANTPAKRAEEQTRLTTRTKL